MPFISRSILVTALFSCATMMAQAYSQPAAVTVAANHQVTTVEIWRDDILRVTHRPLAPASVPDSLTVVAHPQDVSLQRSETADDLIVTTLRIQAHINKQTGAVNVLNNRGESLLSEQPSGTYLATVHAAAAAETIASAQKFVLDPKESLFGLGQHPELATMDLVGSFVRLLQENKEVAIPVLLSSKGYLVLWDNPSVTNVDLGKTSRDTVSWQSEAGSGVDYYFVLGPKPDQAIAGYRWLTGPAPMFPEWAFGFWQSRERYKTQSEILSIVAEYRKRNIPIDGIIQDWQYWTPLNQQNATGGWGSHEFDPSRYADPAGMIKTLHDEHAHLMIVSWAKFDVTDKGVSIPNLKRLEDVKGAFNPAIPYVYPPGRGKWYDPFNDKARDVYWDELSTHLFSLGVDAWWLDASEAELSGAWGEFRDFSTAKGPGSVVYNAYPLEHTRTIYEGQRATSPAKRVFILTRSAYAGQQRHASVTWSGDIDGKWEVLRQQIPAGLNFSASGLPYWNTDIGGFFGSNPDDPNYVDLFTRWFQFGTFTPMFRVHGTDKPKEVWRFDEATQKTLTSFINLRYHLQPYTYSVSSMVTRDGYTMMRPLVMDFQEDTRARKVSDQFLFGPSILVNPVTQPQAKSREVYLPAGASWTDFWTGQSLSGGQSITASATEDSMPLYIRAGSIIPYGPAIQYTNEKPNAPLELRIYPGADGDFTLYEDEGDNYNYERGVSSTIPLHWDDKSATLTIGERRGNFPGMPGSREFKIVRVAPGHGVGITSTESSKRSVTYKGQPLDISIR